MATGRVDVVLLPSEGAVQLVLVEAKVSSAADAASKVVGQLLMYYGGALSLGSNGVDYMRRFALDHHERALGLSQVTPKMLTGGVLPPERAFAMLYGGAPLTPEQIRLFIAIDGDSHRALAPTLATLRHHHGLSIGVLVVRDRMVSAVEID